MIKKILTIFLLVFAFKVNAMLENCGEYQAIGTIIRSESGIELLVNKSSASEYKFKIQESDWSKVVPFLDKSTNITFEITAFNKNYEAEIEKIDSIDYAILDAMNANVNQLKLKNKNECKK